MSGDQNAQREENLGRLPPLGTLRNRLFRNRIARGVVIGALFVITVVYPVSGNQVLPIESRNGIYVTILAVYIELAVRNIEATEAEAQTLDLIADEDDWHSRYEQLEDTSVSSVYSIDYSAQNAKQLLKRCHEENIEVHMLLKMPQVAEIENQRSQITNTLSTKLISQWSREPWFDPKLLNIKYYWHDGVVRGRRIGDECLLVGRYIRTECHEPPWFVRDALLDAVKNPEVSISEDDIPDSSPSFRTNSPQKLWGHNQPAVEVHSGNKYFGEYDEMFSNKLFNTLWDEGITPWELHQLEQAIAEMEIELPEDITDGMTWDSFVTDEIEDSEYRMKMLKRISADENEQSPIRR